MIEITTDLVERTLRDNNDGFKFEKFAQIFMSAITNNTYKPVGGLHDGGADGINENVGLYEDEDKNKAFTQISIDKNPKNKIKRTIQRLNDYGREVKKLTYVTSIVVKDIDKIEDEIFDLYSTRLSIRDAKYITSNIYYSRQTEKAFEENLLDTYDFLKHFGKSSIMKQTNIENNNLAFLFSFIQNELNDKTDRKNLTVSLTDSLILWALEETNPDKDIFMSEEEILNKILENLPTTKIFIKSLFHNRLKELTKQRTKYGRQKIQFRKKSKLYCLPYETRQNILEKNIKDEELFEEVKKYLSKHISSLDNTLSEECHITLLEIIFNILHFIFRDEGLEFSTFINSPEEYTFTKKPLNYTIDEAFEQASILKDKEYKKELITKLINHIFYQTNDLNIKTYLQKLSETYVLLLSLKADGRVVDYFEKMSQNFNLIVGSDILVRALSENLLDSNNKPNTNILTILNKSGAKLICTDYIIDEVWNNIRTSDYEFKNHFAEIEQYMKIEIARESSKILIRSYFYNKLSNDNKKNLHWTSFIDQFCDYNKLHIEAGFSQVKRYLVDKFNLTILEEQEIDEIINKDEVERLTKKLQDTKKSEVLEKNSAINVGLIYGLREKNKESSNGNKFGYKTWWLTNEKTTMKYTKELSKKYNSFYIIRPGFLLHYISLIPSKHDIKQTYQAIFPTIMGVKMAGRISPDEYKKLLNRLKEASKYDSSRLKVKIEEEVDKLKSDFIREYDGDEVVI